MAGTRGQITRSRGRERRTVYLSDAFGVFEEEGNLHITLQRYSRPVHFYLRPEDGMIYYLFRMLHKYGLSLP